MPNCFTLTKKGDSAPADLNKVDEEICALLERPIDPVKYCAQWFDSVSFGLAVGWTFTDMRDTFVDCPDTLKIIDFLEVNYDPHTWVEIGKR